MSEDRLLAQLRDYPFGDAELLREAADTIARLQRERDEAIANVAAAERRISYLCDAHERQWLRADAAAARLRALEGKTDAM